MLKRSRFTVRIFLFAVAMLIGGMSAFAAVPAAPTLYSPTDYGTHPMGAAHPTIIDKHISKGGI